MEAPREQQQDHSAAAAEALQRAVERAYMLEALAPERKSDGRADTPSAHAGFAPRLQAPRHVD
jgi:hypothetical protein